MVDKIKAWAFPHLGKLICAMATVIVALVLHIWSLDKASTIKAIKSLESTIMDHNETSEKRFKSIEDRIASLESASPRAYLPGGRKETHVED